MHRKVKDFCHKCRLLRRHLQQRNFYHFPQLTALTDSKKVQPDEIPIVRFSGVLDGLLQEFADRFQDFEKISATVRLVASPHLVKTDDAPLDL